jgi:hypothetical protein
MRDGREALGIPSQTRRGLAQYRSAQQPTLPVHFRAGTTMLAATGTAVHLAAEDPLQVRMRGRP